VYITCGNEKARSWLLDRIPHVQPWEGAVPRVGATRDVVKTTKFVVWVPTELLTVTEASKILQLLKTQNVGLKTEEWKIINS
jgi:hypothetical protein